MNNRLIYESRNNNNLFTKNKGNEIYIKRIKEIMNSDKHYYHNNLINSQKPKRLFSPFSLSNI